MTLSFDDLVISEQPNKQGKYSRNHTKICEEWTYVNLIFLKMLFLLI